jgi:hypothetical protein
MGYGVAVHQASLEGKEGPVTYLSRHILTKTCLHDLRLSMANAPFDWQMDVFLSKYMDRIEIRHRPGTQHTHADGLSRMPRTALPLSPAPAQTVLPAPDTYVPV